ncbi:hypothetical protein ABT160_02550 [Streptomyces sp. NPDC001941]|uniref:hypothetical protein n=1 Tax=Streptomyces sp. NPDC001941 TaxID=3154659 RepID=UPI0033306DBC
MMTTPADELRIAAAKLRDLADAISAPDPRDRAFHADGATVTQGRSVIGYDVATAETPELAEYIAVMHPGVALALVELLETEAAVADGFRDRAPQITDEQIEAICHGPLAVARAINGGAR